MHHLYDRTEDLEGGKKGKLKKNKRNEKMQKKQNSPFTAKVDGQNSFGQTRNVEIHT